MTKEFNHVSGDDALNTILEQSKHEPVILFNHDPHCPISARAFAQMEHVENDVTLIDVSREKGLTRKVQEQTGIRHESPQVIIVQDGQPIWSASHFEITASAVTNAVNSQT